MRFENRREAGKKLAFALTKYKKQPDTIVLGLPRGGVPVAAEVADALGLPLDIFVVRKVGAPYNEEYAIGAVSQDGGIYIDKRNAAILGIPIEVIHRTVIRKSIEIEERVRKFRGDKPPLELKDKSVILVDDGIATGATIKAAIQVLKSKHLKALIIAIPVAPPSTIMELKQKADSVLCLYQDDDFYAVGAYYDDFTQVSDDEVIEILSRYK